MRRCVLLIFGLALLLCTMAPALEPLDHWDNDAAGITVDTEFHVVVFALGAGLAMAALIFSRHMLPGLRFSIVIGPMPAIAGFVAGADSAIPCSNGPPIRPPLRI